MELADKFALKENCAENLLTSGHKYYTISKLRFCRAYGRSEMGLLSRIQSVLVLCEFHKIIHSSFSNAPYTPTFQQSSFATPKPSQASHFFLDTSLCIPISVRETHMKDRPILSLRKLISLFIENVLYHPESDQQQASREVYQAAEINRTSLPYAKRLSG